MLDVPQTKARPSLFIDPPRPAPAASVVVTDDSGRTQAERQQSFGVVQIADPCIVRKPVTRDCPRTSWQAGAAFQDGRRPFRKTSESLRDCAGGGIAQVQNRIGARIVDSTAAMRRQIKRAARFVFAGCGEIWKHAIKRRCRLRVGPFCNSIHSPNHWPRPLHRQHVNRPGAAEQRLRANQPHGSRFPVIHSQDTG